MFDGKRRPIDFQQPGLGDAPAVVIETPLEFENVDAPFFDAAGTGSGSAGASGGAVATHVLKVVINGTDYWIPLCDTNAS